MAGRFQGGSQLTESQVLDVVMTGDIKRINAWVDHELPIAKPLEKANDVDNSVLTKPVEDVIYKVIRKTPQDTRKIFLEALKRKGVQIRSGDVNELWDHIIKCDYVNIRVWVYSLPLEDVRCDSRGRLVIQAESLLPQNFIKEIKPLIERATPAVREFLLNELCKRGVFVPQEYAKRKPLSDEALLVSLGARPTIFDEPRARQTPGDAAEFQRIEAMIEADALDDLDDDIDLTTEAGSDLGPAYDGPTFYDYSAMVLRLAKNGMLFRPRPVRKEHDFMNGYLPIGKFTAMHQFVINYLSTFQLQSTLEKYVAWYQLNKVPHDLFTCKREDIFGPTQDLVVEYFLHNKSEAALAAALFFEPEDYDPEEYTQRGIYHYIDSTIFYQSVIEYDFMTSLMTRIDLKDMKPTFQTVRKKVGDCAEFLMAIQRAPIPEPESDFGWLVADNLPACKSDSSLFAYLFMHFSFNATVFFEKSPWAKRLGEILSAEEVALRAKMQQAQAALRDWLQHRACVGAFHNTVTVIKPDHNRVWDALISMAVRTALANFKPKRLPKYKMHADDDEYGLLKDRERRKKMTKREKEHEKTEDLPAEVTNTCLSYLDMVTWQDTSDTALVSLYLEAAEAFAHYNPSIFGSKNLGTALDRAYTSGTPLFTELRNPMNFQRPAPLLMSVKQLPQDLRRVFTAFGVVYSKDATDLEEKKRVLRLLTMFFMAYNVRFTKKLSMTILKLEGGLTLGYVRWLLAVGDAFKLNPEQFMQQMTFSNGLFAGRHEILEHMAVLTGAGAGLLPNFRYADDEKVPVWDKTSRFLFLMPGVSPLPGPGVIQGDWLGNSFLRHTLYSMSGAVPFDSLPPVLSTHYHAKRQDAFGVLLRAHEAQAKGTNVLKADAQALSLAREHIDHRMHREELEDVMLGMVGEHRYLVLLNAFELFYPNNALKLQLQALCQFSKQNYDTCRTLFSELTKQLKTPAKSAPEGFHMYHDDGLWTTYMVENILRFAIGVDCAMAPLGAYDYQWIHGLFKSLGFKEGLTVMQELEAQRAGAGNKSKDKPLNSDQMYDLKLEEFKEFTEPNMLLWEYSREREMFYDEVYEYLMENRASPVVIGALYYDFWWHFTYAVYDNPVEPFSATEELRLLYTTIHFWKECNQEVYGRVIRTISARIYCVLLANDLDGFVVPLGKNEYELKLSAFFPRMKKKLLVTIHESTGEETTQTALGRRTIHVDVDPNGTESVMALKRLIQTKEGIVPNEQRITHKGRHLNNERTLFFYDILGDESPKVELEIVADDLLDEREEEEEKQGETATSAWDRTSEQIEEAKRAEEEKSRVLASRMDLDGFLVYQPLERHQYMPEAGEWESKWDLEEKVERIAYHRGIPVEAVEQEMAAEVEGSGEFRDLRQVDVPLFRQVLSMLLFKGLFQQAYFLATDVMDFFPRIWDDDANLTDLKHHLDRIRVVFWAAGIEKLRVQDLGMTIDNVNADVPDWRKKEIPEAANLTNISWLPLSEAELEAYGQRRRLAWNAEAKLDVIKHILLHRFDDLSSDFEEKAFQEAVNHLRKNLASATQEQRIAVLEGLSRKDPREEDPRLAHVCDLFIDALMVEEAEEKQISVAEASAKLITPANKGQLPTLMLIAEAASMSILDVIDLTPTQVIFQMMIKVQDMALIKKYMRVCEPPGSLLPVQYLSEAFVLYIERMVDLPKDEADMDMVAKKMADEAPDLKPFTRNRFLAFTSAAGERRLLHELGHALIAASNRIDLHDITVRAKLKNNLEPLFTLKFETLFCAYFAFFSGAHQEGMKAALEVLDRSLLGLRRVPTMFKMFMQRSLFLTGEYRSLKKSVEFAMWAEPSANSRRAAKEKESVELMKAERAGRDALDKNQRQAWAAAQKDDLEVELASKRQQYIQALLRALTHLQGYELFAELELVASGFKEMAWTYQDNGWYRQAVECHRIFELIHAEMENIPSRLRKFNFVQPDEAEFNQIFTHYARIKPRKIQEEGDDSNEKDDMRRRKKSRAHSRNASKMFFEKLEEKRHRRNKSVKIIEKKGDDDVKRFMAEEDAQADAGPEKDLGPNADPNVLSMDQFEILIADAYLSGAEGRYLETVRRQYTQQARRLQRAGRSIGRVFKFIHQIKDRLVTHFKHDYAEHGTPLTRPEARDMITEAAKYDIEQVGKRRKKDESEEDRRSREAKEREAELEQRYRKKRGESGPGADVKAPNSLLFFVKDRFGKWELGVDRANQYEAEQALVVLGRLHMTKQAQLFKEFYYGDRADL